MGFLQDSHALMLVSAFLKQIDIHLISGIQLVRTIAYADAVGEHLVAVAQGHAMEISAKHHGERIGGTIAHADIHHPLFVSILQTGGHIGTIAHAI